MKISACTITKNEENNIARSIKSYKGYVDEIVIVDTGSTDKTVEIAEELGAKVLHFEWISDFSAAKNFALNNATGDWVIFLDADEWFLDDRAKNIKKGIEETIKNNHDAIACKFINLDESGNIIDAISSMRIFARKPNILFKRKIHEMLYNTDKDIPLQGFYNDDLVINHLGYSKEKIKNKVSRNMSLLEKNYVEGNAETIDYFYLARENSIDSPEYSEKFLNLLFDAPDYKKMLNEVNLGNDTLDLKYKVAERLPEKYSFNDRLKLIKEIENEDKGNPVYDFYRYLLYSKFDIEEAEFFLEEAVKKENEYIKNNKVKNDYFYKYKDVAYYKLANMAMSLNDNIKAMDYYTKSLLIKTRYTNSLKELIYIIGNEKDEDIIIFLNSIFDINFKEDLEFIVNTLRLTKYHKVFLYYFVLLNKKFGEVNVSLFTSRLLTGKNRETAEEYWKIYTTKGEEQALILVAAALITGNDEIIYNEYKSQMPPKINKILAAFFTGEPLEAVNENDITIFNAIFKEIAYVANETVQDKLRRCFAQDKFISSSIIDYYLDNNSYDLVEKEANKILTNTQDIEYIGMLKSVLGIAYFKLNKFDLARETIKEAMKIGDLNQNAMKVYKYIIENTQASEEEKDILAVYDDLIKKNCFAITVEKDKKTDDTEEQEMNIEKFERETKKDGYNVSTSYLDNFYKCAEISFDKKKYNLAETYYKLLIKYEYLKKAICYYKLGEIYNYKGKIELSSYCHNKAFINDLKLAKKILSKGHKNEFYLFRKRDEKIKKACDICGATGNPVKCISHIESENLTENNTVITVYRYCEKCDHIFVENYLPDKEKEMPDNLIKSNRISDAYDLLEKLEENEKIILIDENPEMDLVFKQHKIEIEFIQKSLEKESDINYFVKEICKKITSNDKLVINMFDKDYLTVQEEKCSWEIPGLYNVFSKKSIKKLFEKYEIKIEKIYNSKFEKGRMTVVATKNK